jgi:hypothetical protein
VSGSGTRVRPWRSVNGPRGQTHHPPQEGKDAKVINETEIWGLGYNTIRRLFEDMPGVLKVSQPVLLKRKRFPRVTHTSHFAQTSRKKKSGT